MELRLKTARTTRDFLDPVVKRGWAWDVVRKHRVHENGAKLRETKRARARWVTERIAHAKAWRSRFNDRLSRIEYQPPAGLGPREKRLKRKIWGRRRFIV